MNIKKQQSGRFFAELYYFCNSKTTLKQAKRTTLRNMEERNSIAFVINPISGTQSKTAIVKLVDELLDKERYNPEIVYTEYAGHATQIAAERAKRGYFAVVAVGGDGTINEIARSLVHTETALGIIPCGSGNGLARHLQIPMEVKGALQVINGAKTSLIDYGKINEVPFFCTCGVGFDAFVSLKFSQAGKRGPLTYLEKMLQESLRYKPETYELEMDGISSHYQAFVIACGNASQYGNNAYIAPHASLSDGLLDVTILEPFNMIEAPSLAFQLFNRSIDQNSHVKSFRCRSLRILRKTPGVVHYDGDPMTAGEVVEVKILPKELRVIVPSEVKKSALMPNVFQRAQDYISGLKQINDAIVEDIAQTNRRLFDKGREQIKKLTK